MDINYKIIDTQRIIDYITSFPKGVSVEEIIQNSGAEKLRVYPALFELEQSGFLEVLKRDTATNVFYASFNCKHRIH